MSWQRPACLPPSASPPNTPAIPPTWPKSNLGSRSLGTHIGKPLKNRRCLSRDGAIWACANLRDGVKIIDLPLVSARHTERSRTHATHWSHHRSPSTNTDEFSKGPNQEVRFVLLVWTAPRRHRCARMRS